MKNLLRILIATIAVAICSQFAGCTLATWARIYNRTDYPILFRQSDGKTITILAGAHGPIALWAATKDGLRGFLIVDHGLEHFYTMLPEQKDFPKGALLLPRESGKRRSSGLEYYFEYAGDSELFALSPDDEADPKRLSPQPVGFPVRPIQSATDQRP